MDDERPLTKMQLRDIEDRERAEAYARRSGQPLAEYRAQFDYTQTRLLGDNDHWIPPTNPLMIFCESEDDKPIDRVDAGGRFFFGHRPVSDEHVEQYWEYLSCIRLSDPEAFTRLLTRYQHVEDAYIEKLKDNVNRWRVRREKREEKRKLEARKIRLF